MAQKPKFQCYDVVKVVRSPKPANGLIGSIQLGQLGSVVMAYDNPEGYTVEAVTKEGRTLWVLDFSPEELEFVSRPKS